VLRPENWAKRHRLASLAQSVSMVCMLSAFSAALCSRIAPQYVGLAKG
jgi:hypothetical protein